MDASIHLEHGYGPSHLLHETSQHKLQLCWRQDRISKGASPLVMGWSACDVFGKMQGGLYSRIDNRESPLRMKSQAISPREHTHRASRRRWATYLFRQHAPVPWRIWEDLQRLTLARTLHYAGVTRLFTYWGPM